MNQIETEVKYKIRATDVAEIIIRAKDEGFVASESEAIRDCFLSIAPSPHGGWDFVRLRSVDGLTFCRTEKRWIADTAGRRIRLEKEREIAESTFKRLSRKRMGVEIRKERTNLKGRAFGRKITVSIDAVTVGGKTYHFIEGEAITDVESSHSVRAEIQSWLHRTLGVRAKKEAPSMLDFIWSVTKK